MLEVGGPEGGGGECAQLHGIILFKRCAVPDATRDFDPSQTGAGSVPPAGINHKDTSPCSKCMVAHVGTENRCSRRRHQEPHYLFIYFCLLLKYPIPIPSTKSTGGIITVCAVF